MKSPKTTGLSKFFFAFTDFFIRISFQFFYKYMFDIYSDGKCPQCLLDGVDSDMALNKGDHWECPICKLQARGGANITILAERGNGEFKKPQILAKTYVVGSHMYAQDRDEPLEVGSAIQSEAQLRTFLNR
jgi:hypothetical protein